MKSIEKKITVRLSEGELKQIIRGKIHITLKNKMVEKLLKLQETEKDIRVLEYHLRGL